MSASLHKSNSSDLVERAQRKMILQFKEIFLKRYLKEVFFQLTHMSYN